MDSRNLPENFIKPFIYLVVIILVNIAGLTLYLRIDLTKNKIYSLSEASKEVVCTLSEPLTIKVFFTQDLPAPHNNTERYLHDLLEEYAIHANKYFNYRFYNVTPETQGIAKGARENQALADSYGIRPVQIQVLEKDEVKFKKAYMGLVLIHGDMIEQIPTITSTDGLEYKLTTAIQKLNNKISALLSLHDKVQVKLYLSSSLKKVAPFMGLRKLSELPGKVKDIVNELGEKSYGKLAYSYVDPVRPEEQEKISQKYKIMSLNWPTLPAKNIKAGEGIIGLVMEYGGRVKTIQLMHVMRIPIFGTQYSLVDPSRLEQMINDNLESLIGINMDIGYLADHGTLKIARYSPMEGEQPESLSNFSNLVSRNYTIREINLKDDSIPESLQSLVIARPTEEFTDYELYQIDQALMVGTNLAIFLDSFKEVMPPKQQPYGYNRGPSYVPLNTGLEKLLDHYGIRIKKSIVLDENCYKQNIPRRFGGGERPIYFAPLIKNRFINHGPKFMKDIKELVALKISPLELDEQRISKNGIKALKLFSSSERSWEMRNRINFNPMFTRPPSSGKEEESMPLAYLLEGQFNSYFAGKPMPEKMAKESESENQGQKKSSKNAPVTKGEADLSKIQGKGVFMAKSRPAKILLIASSAMLQDNILDREGKGPNSVFVMNILDALNDRGDIAAMRGKTQRFNPLNETSALVKTVVKTFNIAGLPILVIVFGLFVWVRRHSRKRRIQMMFQK